MVHIKGTVNVLIDYLSRVNVHNSNWELNGEVFREIILKWGIAVIDLFGSRQNRKVAAFFSQEGEMEALGMDALHFHGRSA